MEKFAIASTASKDVVKILIDDLETSQDDLSEARDKINNSLEDLREGGPERFNAKKICIFQQSKTHTLASLVRTLVTAAGEQLT